MAIEANELRIGNWVRYKAYNVKIDGIVDVPNEKYKKVSGSNWDIESSISGDFEFKDIFGIPLAPEILKKTDCSDLGNGWFGFEKEGFCFSFNHAGCVDDAGCLLHDYKMEFLHQFQNWYFTKTGKELEINL